MNVFAFWSVFIVNYIYIINIVFTTMQSEVLIKNVEIVQSKTKAKCRYTTTLNSFIYWYLHKYILTLSVGGACLKRSIFSKHLIQLSPYNCEIKSAANQNMLCKSDIAVFAFGRAAVLLH